MDELFDDSRVTAVRHTGGIGPGMPAAPMIERRGYDVGPGCPQDDLQRRLDEARVRLRLHPPPLAAPLRWSI